MTAVHIMLKIVMTAVHMRKQQHGTYGTNFQRAKCTTMSSRLVRFLNRCRRSTHWPKVLTEMTDLRILHLRDHKISSHWKNGRSWKSSRSSVSTRLRQDLVADLRNPKK